MKPTYHCQFLWLTEQLIQKRVPQLETVVLELLKNIKGIIVRRNVVS